MTQAIPSGMSALSQRRFYLNRKHLIIKQIKKLKFSGVTLSKHGTSVPIKRTEISGLKSRAAKRKQLKKSRRSGAGTDAAVKIRDGRQENQSFFWPAIPMV